MATFRHVGLTVSNKEEYCSLLNILEFEKVWDKHESGDYINKFNNEVIKFVNTVKFKDKNGAMIELLCYDNNISTDKIKSLRSKGISHIALSVDNLSSVIKRLDKSWLKLVHQPLLVPSGNVKVCFVEDIKNGIFLELVEEIK